MKFINKFKYELGMFAAVICGVVMLLGSIVFLGDAHPEKTYRVNQYSTDGHLIQTWHSKGIVSSISHSDIFCFTDRLTGKEVQVTGTIQVTQP